MSQHPQKNAFDEHLCFPVVLNQALGVRPVAFVLPCNCENLTSDNNTQNYIIHEYENLFFVLKYITALFQLLSERNRNLSLCRAADSRSFQDSEDCYFGFPRLFAC